MPPPVPPSAAGSRLNLLLIPVPGERRAESALALPPSVAAPSVAPSTAQGERERRSVAAQSAAPELSRRRQPIVSAGPISPPVTPPASQVSEANTYVAPETLTAFPEFVSPFAMSYPRRAFEEGRRGVVVVQVLIDETGRVVEALAAPGAPEDFAEAALAGLRAARFRPGQAGGKPVRARAYFAVSFVIE
ncbi:MAG: periplasmic protein TonB [Betaproteobacteria bacterium]|nr:periplasmic protein TonB [Betaproteobacteria bacterium]